MKKLISKKKITILSDWFSKRRIVFLSVFAGLMYAWMLLSYFSSEWEDAKIGFYRGFGVEGYQNQESMVKDSLFKVYYIRVSPKQSVLYFPEQVQADNQEIVDTRFSQMKVALTEEYVKAAEVGMMENIEGILILCMGIIYLLLPFRFYKLISVLKKGDFFSLGNIRIVRQMGWMMIGLNVFDYLSKYLSWRINLELFEFDDYVIVPYSSDGFLIVVGVVALLLAEIFAKGALLEKEQRLTI